jgi:hypothetical protein
MGGPSQGGATESGECRPPCARSTSELMKMITKALRNFKHDNSKRDHANVEELPIVVASSGMSSCPVPLLRVEPLAPLSTLVQRRGEDEMIRSAPQDLEQLIMSCP